VRRPFFGRFFVCLAGHRSSLRTCRFGLSRHILTRLRSLRYSTDPPLTVLPLSTDSLCQPGKKSVDIKRENLMTSIRTIEIHPDGTILTTTMPAENLGDTLCRTIDCRVFDVVALENGIDLFVDDEGLLDGSALNLCATVLAHQLGAGAAIFGIAVAVSVDAGGTTLGLSDEQVTRIATAMNQQPDTATVDRLAETLAPFPGIVQLLRG
jgi:hypothetical protein